MYCKDCKQYFDTPKASPMDETGWVEVTCPCCGSDYIEETYTCKCCGEDKADSPGGFCNTCRETLAEELEDLQRRFEITASDLEDMIAEHYGY